MHGSFSSQAADTSAANPTFLAHLSWSRRWQSRDQSADFATQVLDLTKAAPDSEQLARGMAFNTLAWQSKWRGNFDATMAYCKRAQRYFENAGNLPPLADTCAIMGVVHYSQGRRDLAREAVDKGFALLGARAAPATRIDLLCTLSTIRRYTGDMTEAGARLNEALALAEGAEIARVEHNIARALNHDENFAEALGRASTAVQAAHRHANRVILPYALEVQGTSLIELGQTDHALEVLQTGADLAQADNDRRVYCQILLQIGRGQMDLGLIDDGIETLRAGFACATEMNYPIWRRLFAERLALAYEDLGQYKSAATAYKDAISVHNATKG